MKRDKGFLVFSDDNPGKELIKTSWKGAKMIGFAVLAGAALGLGVGAFNSVSS